METTKTYKTFADLDFHPWTDGRKLLSSDTRLVLDLMTARLDFPNGYGVSVLLGKYFNSNGVDTYDLAVMRDNQVVFPSEVCPDGDVLGYLTADEVTEAMRKIQDLP